MIIDYSKRLVEVDEILNYLIKEDYEKIPKEIIQAIKENKDKNYTWKYDETKTLKEQKISRETISILSYINMEYLLNEEQKKLMKKIHQLNQEKYEQENVANCNVDNIF